MPPTGAVLGRNAISFVDGPLAEAFGRDPGDLRYAVSFVDDVYGRSVADGALQAAADLDLEVVGRFGYDFRTVDYDALARRIDRSGADVLFVSAYLVDAVELRRALVRNDVDLLASIGTSSSYCMPEFGAALGDGRGRPVRLGQAQRRRDRPVRRCGPRAPRCSSVPAPPTASDGARR